VWDVCGEGASTGTVGMRLFWWHVGLEGRSPQCFHSLLYFCDDASLSVCVGGGGRVAMTSEQKGVRYKPCRSTVYPPSGFLPEKHKELLDLPQQSLVLEYVHGYSCRSCKGPSLFCTFDGRLVYPTSAVVVVLSVRSNTQDHFLKHEDEITAICMHPNGRIFASGETGLKPRIFVWDAGTLEGDEIRTVGSPLYLLERSVSTAALQFSPDGKLLIGIGNDNNHTAHIWQHETGLLVYDGRSAQAPVNAISFMSMDAKPTSDSSNYAFTSIGAKHIRFWTMHRRQLSSRWTVESNTANFKCMINCVSHNNFGLCVAGDALGTLHFYCRPRKDPLPGRAVDDLPPRGDRGVLVGKVGKVHARGVTAIAFNQILKNGMYATGGGDGSVTIRLIRKRPEDNAITHKQILSFQANTLSTGRRDEVKSLDWGFESKASLEAAAITMGQKTTKAKPRKLRPGGNKAASAFLPKKPDGDSRPSGRSTQKERPRRLVLFIGLKSSTIVKLTFETPPGNEWIGSPPKFTARVIQYGHANLVECVAANIDENYFVTASRDRVVRVWDLMTHRCLSEMRMDGPACAVSLHPGYTEVCVGLVNAAIVVLSLSNIEESMPPSKGTGKSNEDSRCQNTRRITLKLKHHIGVGVKNKSTLSLKKAGDSSDEEGPAIQKAFKSMEEVQVVTYSPSGEFLAVGSRDNYIYIYDVKSHFKLLTQLRGHSSFVLSIDWSVDSKSLQSADGAHELMYWSHTPQTQGRPFVQDPHAIKLADQTWDTWTNIFGWPVQGIWKKNSDATDINSVARSVAGELVLTGDDFRRVNLFRFPCLPGAEGRAFSGHHSHIPKVCWARRDDSMALSCGGSDACVFVWKVYDPTK
jgi:WD40 repeat protein